MLASSPDFFLILSAVIFAIGATGLTLRRNPLVMFMSIELMLNAANLAFLTFSRFGEFQPQMKGSSADGTVFTFIVITIAAAEAVVGLAIIITIFRKRQLVDVDALSTLKG